MRMDKGMIVRTVGNVPTIYGRVLENENGMVTVEWPIGFSPKVTTLPAEMLALDSED